MKEYCKLKLAGAAAVETVAGGSVIDPVQPPACAVPLSTSMTNGGIASANSVHEPFVCLASSALKTTEDFDCDDNGEKYNLVQACCERNNHLHNSSKFNKNCKFIDITIDEDFTSLKGRKCAIDGLRGLAIPFSSRVLALEAVSGVTSTRPAGPLLVLRLNVDVKCFGSYGTHSLLLLNMLSVLRLGS